MATDVHSREQRLRKQAELQSLYLNLASLREREASYMDFSTVIPERLANQINETRQEMQQVEDELLTLGDETISSPARQPYWEAFAAELSGDLAQAINLYKSASRHTHPDAGAALRSVRYAVRTAKSKTAGGTWTRVSVRSRNRFWIGLAIILIIIFIVMFVLAGRFKPETIGPVVAGESTPATPTPPTVVLIIPHTATPLPTPTPTFTPMPIPTVTLTPTPAPPEETPTPTPTPGAMLRPPPRIIGPKNGLVWKDGSIVFEFENLYLAYNELVCLNPMKGFDQTNTENWSHPVVGSKKPFITIEPNVFRVAKQQGIQCVVWSAYVAVDSCDNAISQSTEERVIGLPNVCNFK